MDIQTKMTRARIQLMLDEPFFGSLLLNLAPRRDDSIGTMATDGRSLIWSGKFAAKLSIAQLKTVLAHEALHCGLLHHLRRGDRDNGRWNQAADYALNSVLEQCNQDAIAAGRPVPFTWPTKPAPLLDSAYAGQSAEEIYGRMPEPPPGQSGDGKGQPGMGDVQDDPGAAQDPGEANQQEANWKQAVVQAATAAKGRGTMPAAMARLVEEMLNPKASWREILRRFVSDRAADDYSWQRPNRRYAASGFILPSLYSQRLGTIGIIRDTSGSCQDWQAEILAELAGIISETRPGKIVVIDADADVQRVLELDSTDALPTDAIGGGGTDFRPALERMEDYSPVCCVYLTDLDGRMPDAAPSYPVLWATDSERQTPFGEVVRV